MNIRSSLAPTHQRAERFTIPAGGGVLAGWRWPNRDAPPLLFCHATGFCASAYRRMLAPLADRFDVYAVDMRGHGRTLLPADAEGLRSWSVYADDISSFLDAQARGGWILSGHSMGGVASVMAARGRGDIAGLVLVEPVSIPPLLNWVARTPFWALYKSRIPQVAGALRRRAHWPDREAARAAYARKGVFRNWAPGVLDDYLKDGLVADETGVRLACAPVWEAATFAAHANDLWGAVAAAPAPISVLAADHHSTTLFGLARARYRRFSAEITLLEGASHLAPMEKPQDVAEFIARAAP